MTPRAAAADPVVMTAYQRLLRRVIEANRDVVLGYLGAGGRSGSSPPVTAAAAVASAVKGPSPTLPLAPPGSLRRLAPDTFELGRELDLRRDLYLDHHRLDGRPVLPAAMALELMTEAASCCRPELELVEVLDFRVLRGIVLGADPLALRAVASLLPGSSAGSGAEVQVELRAEDGWSGPRYRAIVRLADRLPQLQTAGAAPLEGLQPFPLSVAEASERWLFHGPLFAAVVAVDGVSEQGIRARLRPSCPQQCLAGDAAGEWLIDPIVIDGSFQMVILWSRLVNDMTPLPSRFDRYLRLGSLTGPELGCEIMVTSRGGGRSLTTRHLFSNGDGSPIGLLEGMESTCSPELNRLAGFGSAGSLQP